MVISIDVEKDLTFFITIISKVGIKRNSCNLTENLKKKLYLMLRNRYFYQEQSRDAPVSTLIQHLTESFSLCSKTREGKKKKKIQIGKGRNETVFACRWHDCLHRNVKRLYNSNPGTSNQL